MLKKENGAGYRYIMKKPIKIAIIGATGHIAKGLITVLCDDPQFELFLFARSIDKLAGFLDENKLSARVHCAAMPTGGIEGRYDALINCTGVGKPAALKAAADNIFLLTELFDNMLIRYLDANPEAVYINMSSGAVYGGDFSSPAGPGTRNAVNVNGMNNKTYYSLAKLNAEAKHRSLHQMKIIDLRVFSYFSRFIDLESGYLVAEIINAVQEQKVFKTNGVNIVRDYIGPADLASLIRKCLLNPGNGAYDVYSRAPISKAEMLEAYKKEFGLSYETAEGLDLPDTTGVKPKYFSEDRRAASIGFEPKYSSVETLINESKHILGGK
jgi:nucleoside-diphosphate-sugar epimerase